MRAPYWYENIAIWFGAVVASVRHNWKPKLKRVRLHLVAFALFALGIFQAVDPYALSMVLPERWAAIIPGAFGVIIWLLRKATANPPLVTTTYHGEATTDPYAAVAADIHARDDVDGEPVDYDGSIPTRRPPAEWG